VPGRIGGHTHSVCTVDHAESFWADYQEFLKNPGPDGDRRHAHGQLLRPGL
jgi:hypothetical protein